MSHFRFAVLVAVALAWYSFCCAGLLAGIREIGRRSDVASLISDDTPRGLWVEPPYLPISNSTGWTTLTAGRAGDILISGDGPGADHRQSIARRP